MRTGSTPHTVTEGMHKPDSATGMPGVVSLQAQVQVGTARDQPQREGLLAWLAKAWP
jgi:hypothetical protein